MIVTTSVRVFNCPATLLFTDLHSYLLYPLHLLVVMELVLQYEDDGPLGKLWLYGMKITPATGYPTNVMVFAV